ncbi:hypothetical protein [Streptomyces olivaceus]|uniref:hypothetical protein n=1 Tax=Streptomyces olivaceus TaxID=47716 RepID=UPI0036CF15F4
MDTTITAPSAAEVLRDRCRSRLPEDLAPLLHHRPLSEQWPVLQRLISSCTREIG